MKYDTMPKPATKTIDLLHCHYPIKNYEPDGLKDINFENQKISLLTHKW